MHHLIWRRLDDAGHDACRFMETASGWTVEGAAVFRTAGEAAHLAYRILCEPDWTSRAADVAGFVGGTSVARRLERDGAGGWRVDGVPAPDLDGLLDVDLGFTPASNTNAIRRLALGIGDAGRSTAVWLDTADWTVKPLPQSYRRVADDGYDYASPTHGYRARLRVDGFGAVVDYPDLWIRVGGSDGLSAS